jgi:hypothetical protein
MPIRVVTPRFANGFIGLNPLYVGLDALWLRRKVGNSYINDVSCGRYELKRLFIIGQTGWSVRIREKWWLLDEAGLERDSAKPEWLFGGGGEQERGVQRELWPECVGSIGM